MKNSFKSFIFDLFFIISSFIGVGFATGKELEQFFLKGNVFIGVAIFFVCILILSILILHIKNKYLISNITQLNKLAFGKYYYIVNNFLLILFVVTSSAMLAGCDNIMKNIFDINLPIFSIFFSFITFFIIIGGIKRIKCITNYIMPILIVIILINVCLNINSNISIQSNLSTKEFIFPLLFIGENCITLISVLIKTKSNPKKISFATALILTILISLSLFAIIGVNADMPMVEISKNSGKIFFTIYLIAVILALFTTLQINSFNGLEICLKQKKNKIFVALIIVGLSQSLSFLGFVFIMKYLYLILGILGGIYILILIIKLIILNKK